MANLAYPSSLVGLAGAVPSPNGVAPLAHIAAHPLGLVSGTGKNWLLTGNTSGTISNNNRVMLKADPSAPELPFVGARVRLHRLTDGYCAWQGQSDAQGYYWPTGLEVGVAYYPVAIDMSGAHECDAAGPVVATQAI